MKALAILLALAALALPHAARAQAQQQAQPAQAKPTEPSPSAQEIIFAGKLFSPMKLSVAMPYTAQIKALTAKIGQKVNKDDVLATFEIAIETRMAEKRSLSLANVKDIEHQLASNAKEIDRLKAKRQELEVMAKQNMATSQALVVNSQEMDVQQKLRASLQEKLAVEREQAQQRLDLARERFGSKADFGNLPKEGIVKSPAAGYVLWINPELREGVKLGKDTELFQVGVLDPIIIRAQVHEIEALRLNVGDKAKVTFDSLPGKEFTAQVSRIPWAPMPTALQQPSYYEIELTLPNPDYALKEGLKALVTIIPKK